VRRLNEAADEDQSRYQVIEEAKFKTFGCGTLLASLLARYRMVKARRRRSAFDHTDIVREGFRSAVEDPLLRAAEDAIKAAIGDWKKKHGVEVPFRKARH